KFGHHFLRGRSEHERLSMATIGGHREVLGVTRGERSHNRRFRAISKMGVAAHGSGMLEEGALDVLFEFADSRHLDVDPDQPVFTENALVWHCITPFCTCWCSAGRPHPAASEMDGRGRPSLHRMICHGRRSPGWPIWHRGPPTG